MKLKTLLLTAGLLPVGIFAQLSAPGDIAFTGFNADGEDDLAFVTFVDIPANSDIYFCDASWTGTDFLTNEGDFTWNSGSAEIPKGTIITINSIDAEITANIGSITIDNAGGLSSTDEGLYAFLGTAPRMPTTFLAAIANDSSGFGTLDGTGLTQGQTAIVLTASTDIGQYIGPRTGFNSENYIIELNNISENWVEQSGSDDQSNDGTVPDLPFDTTMFEFDEGGEINATIALDEEYTIVNENEEFATVQVLISNASDFDISAEVVLLEGGNAANGTDFNFTTQTVNFPAGTTEPVTIEIPLLDNSTENPDRFFLVELSNVSGGTISGIDTKSFYIIDNDGIAPEASNDLDVEFLTSYLVDGEGTSEIVSFDKESQRLFILNSTATKVNIIDFSNPSSPTEITSLDMSVYGDGATSVAVYNGLVAATVDGVDEENGKVVFMDINGENVSIVNVGHLPDMVTFSHDGTKVLTANEGEPNSEYTFDPEGTISIIDVSGGIGNISQEDVTTLNFNAFDAQIDELRSLGVRIFGPNATVSQDLEPEYITISEDNTKAWVSLQENNALAVIDLVDNVITDILPLGYKNHSLAGNELDASDKISAIFMSSWPIKGMYMPDAIANYTIDGITYVITANEGDARDYDGYSEESRIKDDEYVLDETSFPNASILKEDNNLGRLNATLANGDIDGDGQFEEIYVYGGRSFSIYNTETGEQVFDSGAEFERITAADPVFGAIFNADNEEAEFKNRSDNKGPEPEGVAIAEINDKFYAFITLERIGGIMVYDVTNPANPEFVAYKNNRDGENGDMAPEGIIYISPEDNATEKGLIVVANEVSATVSVYRINNDEMSLSDAIADKSFKIYPNPVNKGVVYFSKPISGELFSLSGQKISSFVNKAHLNVENLKAGIYIIKSSEGITQKLIIK